MALEPFDDVGEVTTCTGCWGPVEADDLCGCGDTKPEYDPYCPKCCAARHRVGRPAWTLPREAS